MLNTKNNATEATETGTGTSKLKKPLLQQENWLNKLKNHLRQAAKHSSLEVTLCT